MTARIRFEDAGRRGVLELDAGGSTNRAVVGRDCTEVSDGMALIVAMAVDPRRFVSPPTCAAITNVARNKRPTTSMRQGIRIPTPRRPSR